MADYANNYRLFMIRAEGRVELQNVVEYSDDIEKEKAKIFTTSSPKSARGMRSGPSSGSGELTIAVDAEPGNFQVPWYKMLDSNEQFSIVKMRKGATAQIDATLLDCEITTIGDSHNPEDGESQLAISFEYLRVQPQE